MSGLPRKAPPVLLHPPSPHPPRSKPALRADDIKCVKEGSSWERAPGGHGEGAAHGEGGLGVLRPPRPQLQRPPSPPGDVPTDLWQLDEE